MTEKNDLSFKSIEKIFWIIDQLEQYRKFSVLEFGTKFYGDKFKTRDLEPFINKLISSNFLGLKNLIVPYVEKPNQIDNDGKMIEADKSLHREGFVILPDNAVIENIKFGESDLLIEAIIKKMSQTPYINPLFTSVSMEKLDTKIEGLQTNIAKKDAVKQKDSKLISNRIVYHFSEYEKIDDKLKSNLNRILQSFPYDTNNPKSHCIEFSYKKLDGDEKNETILPLKLVNYQGKWYVLGLSINDYDNNYDLCKVTQFRVARMNEIKLRKQTFIVSDEDEEKLENLLSRNFGIGIGQSNQNNAKIRFTGDVAKMIAEIQWHPDQTLSNEAEGSVIMSIKYPIDLSNELLGRVLRYGRFAQILEPEDLRKKWKDEIAEMSKLQ